MVLDMLLCVGCESDQSGKAKKASCVADWRDTVASSPKGAALGVYVAATWETTGRTPNPEGLQQMSQSAAQQAQKGQTGSQKQDNPYRGHLK